MALSRASRPGSLRGGFFIVSLNSSIFFDFSSSFNTAFISLRLLPKSKGKILISWSSFNPNSFFISFFVCSLMKSIPYLQYLHSSYYLYFLHSPPKSLRTYMAPGLTFAKAPMTRFIMYTIIFPERRIRLPVCGPCL